MDVQVVGTGTMGDRPRGDTVSFVDSLFFWSHFVDILTETEWPFCNPDKAPATDLLTGTEK